MIRLANSNIDDFREKKEKMKPSIVDSIETPVLCTYIISKMSVIRKCILYALLIREIFFSDDQSSYYDDGSVAHLAGKKCLKGPLLTFIIG